MSSSNIAARNELAVADLLVESPRLAPQVTTNSALKSARNRPRTSLKFRRIVKRDHGLRSFRVF